MMQPPTQAALAYPKTHWEVGAHGLGCTSAGGDFIWDTRSVQVSGALAGAAGDVCQAVIFTAYDQDDRVIAGATRPGPGNYYCGVTRHGFGFTLDASSVPGGIRYVVVDLWERNARTGHAYRAGSTSSGRP
ncbi:hypothetical protein [Embleya sp. AB8]|uniref:hypothetical protein n=1 Tax=Embleya sp. AB8 TaxID=3156304 RepID=UPI003C789FAB